MNEDEITKTEDALLYAFQAAACLSSWLEVICEISDENKSHFIEYRRSAYQLEDDLRSVVLSRNILA